jgi:hypothetical protein
MPLPSGSFDFSNGSCDLSAGKSGMSCLNDRNIILVVDDDPGMLEGLQRLPEVPFAERRLQLVAAENHQPCASCGGARHRIFSEPIARRYDLHLLLCPNCLTTVRLVSKRPLKKKTGRSAVRYRQPRYDD